MRAAPSIFYAAVAALLVGCSDATGPVPSPDGSEIQDPTPSPFAISPASANIQVGESRQFTTIGSARPALAAGPTNVAWHSSDPTIASVTRNGLVRGVGIGQARVVVTWGAYQSSALVTVTRDMKEHENPTVCLLRLPTAGHPGPAC